MRNPVIVLALSLFALSSAAQALESKVYYKDSPWHSPDSTFSPIEISGARFDAVEKAWADCRGGGHRLCALAHTEMNRAYSDNGYNINYKAFVRELDRARLTPTREYSGRGDFWSYRFMRPIENQGVKGLALEQAIAYCLMDNTEYCVITGIQYERNNSDSRGGYQTTAIATVQGYRTGGAPGKVTAR
jgi:hypothetical protein